MSHADFVHLRVHSAYSLSEGAIKIKDLIKLCKKERMPAVAITDTGNLFGALEFASAAADEGVQPIIGVQLGLKRGGSPTRPGLRPEPDQLVLLAQNAVGYANLIKLVSQGCLENEEGHPAVLPLSALEGLTEGLIALTGGPSGPVGRLLNEGQRPAAEVALADLMRLFPDRLYVELMRHGLDTEKRIEAALIELADSNGLQLVATNECFFADDGMYEAHDALLCIAGGTYVTEEDEAADLPVVDFPRQIATVHGHHEQLRHLLREGHVRQDALDGGRGTDALRMPPGALCGSRGGEATEAEECGQKEMPSPVLHVDTPRFAGRRRVSALVPARSAGSVVRMYVGIIKRKIPGRELCCRSEQDDEE